MGALAVFLGGSAFLFAEEPKPAPAASEAAPAAATDPAVTAAKEAGEDTKAQAKKVRLTRPWKDLASLSQEQQTQIAAIHRKAVQEIKQIERREREEIMALLSAEQKTELQTLMDKAAAERKAKKPTKAENAEIPEESAATER